MHYISPNHSEFTYGETNEINQVETQRTPLEVPEINVTSQMDENNND